MIIAPLACDCNFHIIRNITPSTAVHLSKSTGSSGRILFSDTSFAKKSGFINSDGWNWINGVLSHRQPPLRYCPMPGTRHKISSTVHPSIIAGTNFIYL